MQLVTVALDCVINLFFFFSSFSLWLSKISYGNTSQNHTDKSCFSSWSHRSAIWVISSSWSTQASVGDRVCSQWHSSPSRQLWTPWVEREKKNLRQRMVSLQRKNIGVLFFFFFSSVLCSFNLSSVPPTHQWSRENHEAGQKTVPHKNNSDFITLLGSQQRIREKQLPKSSVTAG